jgi:hypothetical protein
MTSCWLLQAWARSVPDASRAHGSLSSTSSAERSCGEENISHWKMLFVMEESVRGMRPPDAGKRQDHCIFALSVAQKNSESLPKQKRPLSTLFLLLGRSIPRHWNGHIETANSGI